MAATRVAEPLPLDGPAVDRPGRMGRGAWLLRIAGSLAFLALALWGIGLGDVLGSLRGMRAGWLAAGLAALTTSFVIAAGRWWVVLRAVDVSVSLATAMEFTFVGLFFNNALPTGMGGDAVRAWMLGTRTGRLGAVTASVLVDRLAAVWALMAVGLGAIAFEAGDVPGWAIAGMAAVTLAVAAGTFLLLLPGPAARVGRLVSRWSRVAQAVGGVDRGLARYRAQPGVLARAFALSLAAQACVVLAAWLLARGLGLDAGPLLLAAVIPVALLATAVPTSINGLGPREAAFRALLVPAGIAPADAVAFSLTTVLAAALVSLPGAACFLILRNRRAGPTGRRAAAQPRR